MPAVPVAVALRRLRRLRIVAVFSFSLLLASPALADRIVVFGDSWGVPAAPALEATLLSYGLNIPVANAAVGGETAANLSLASGLQHITDTLAANLDCDLVHLSIGGNDFLGNWTSSMTPAQETVLFESIRDDVETIVDHILTQRPSARILWSSYDYPRPLSPLGTPTEVNAASHAYSVYAEALAVSKGASLTYGDYLGLMQWTFGFDGSQPSIYDPPVAIPPYDASLPDATLPSPAATFSDAIHLTATGYSRLADEHYWTFYKAILAPSVPMAGLLERGLLGLLLVGFAKRKLRRRDRRDASD